MNINITFLKKHLLKTALLSISIFSSPLFVAAQNVKIAVAANLQGVIKVLQQDFLTKTKIKIEPIVGASGNLSNQIKNGAPFDIFLSADTNFPENLFKTGFAAKKPQVYALGSLILCSNKDMNLDRWEELLQHTEIKKIAIANPATAPYGKAATEVLQHKNLLQKVQSKIVYGESISQVNIYITTGVAELGFTTEALIFDAANKQKLYWKRIDSSLYKPIEQAMVLLKHAKGNLQAEKFYQYLSSPAAQNILKKYGYQTK